jgi:hypothetical protein
MPSYCTCHTCATSPARPHAIVHGTPEIVSGALLQLSPGDSLVHWSGRGFVNMMSTEIAWIQRRGINPRPVCASFYWYRAGTEIPLACPQGLKVMGLAGPNRYSISAAVSSAYGMSIYVKGAIGAGASTEVVVALGCGGYITFNDERNAVGMVKGHNP